jgi:hypothetical protein
MHLLPQSFGDHPGRFLFVFDQEQSHTGV